MTTVRFSRPMRVAAVLCVLVAAVLWLTAGRAAALGPDKTAWYDTTDLQQYTGETTPSVAGAGQLEVAYEPAAVTEPTETTPSVPVTPPTLPPSAPVGVPVPSLGQVGGATLGGTLAFATLEYTVPLQVGGQSINPSSISGVLTLSLDPSNSVGMASGDMVACPTTNALWASGDDQPDTQAPPYDCAAGTAVTGNYDSASNTVTFNLNGEQEYQGPSGPTGIFSLALVPGTSPSGPFTAVIDSPSASSFAITNESPGSNAEENLAADGSSGSFGLSGSGVNSSSGPLSPLSAAGSSPAQGTTPTSSTATPGAVDLGVPAAATGLGGGSQRTIAVILLAALAAGLWMGASNTGRTPRSLRPVHAPAPGPAS
jgi:hypothetical protein